MKTLKALKFLVVGPVLIVFLFIVNLMTSPGDWWFQWAALGIGIAWVFSLLHVIKALVLAGGLAALLAYLGKKSGNF